MTDDIQFFDSMTYNAEQWSDYFLEEGVNRSQKDRYAEVLSRIQQDILAIISANIKQETVGHKEYGRFGWMTSELITAFNNVDIIRVDPTTGIIDLYKGAEAIAGTLEDYDTGVLAAYAELDMGTGKSPAKRAQIWKDIIWPNDYLYTKTMAARRRGWGDKAPWWNWLEYGNKGLEGAFPQVGPTSFLFLAQTEANELFQTTLESVENEEYNIVEQAYARFLLDPDSYSVHDVLGEFYMESKRYNIYVTPTFRIGVAQRIRR
jgi:hypothetical protein